MRGPEEDAGGPGARGDGRSLPLSSSKQMGQSESRDGSTGSGPCSMTKVDVALVGAAPPSNATVQVQRRPRYRPIVPAAVVLVLAPAPAPHLSCTAPPMALIMTAPLTSHHAAPYNTTPWSCPGEVRGVAVVPLPSCPLALTPHMCRAPVLSSAAMWLMPQSTATAVRPKSVPDALSDTLTGRLLEADWVPSPT